MRAVSSFAIPAILGVLSRRISGQLRRSCFLAGLLFAMASMGTAHATTAATPVISLASGSYASAQTVTISDTTPGATIYYTTNGAYPNTNSTIYSSAITVSTSEIVVAVAVASGYSNSSYATAEYFIDSSTSRFIYTIAGSRTPGYTGDGGPATLAELNNVKSVALDSAGNVYMAESEDNVVRKVAAGTGIITTTAGTGVAGHTGDNGPAAGAELWTPTSVAVDPTGNLFIGEVGDGVVRRVDAVTGTITTFVDYPATFPTNLAPAALACDRFGNLYIAESLNVFEVNAVSGNISQIASSSSNDAQYFSGIAVDSNLNVYVSFESYATGEYGGVWKISPQGVTTAFAGANGATGGDGGPATSAGLNYPEGLAVDASGNVYIADSYDFAIREVNTSGIINTVAGIFSIQASMSGDGSPATDVELFPTNIAVDGTGNLYLAGGDAIEKITAPASPPTLMASTPVLSLAAGTYSSPQTLTMSDATPGAAIYVSLNGVSVNTANQGYHGLIDITGTVAVQAFSLAPGYLASAPASAKYTITAPPTAVISTVAGNGTYGLSGAGGPATSANIGEPQGIAFDGTGNLYIADGINNVVWMVAASTGDITIVAGTGTWGYGGDGGQATAAELSTPTSVALDKYGNLYIGDWALGRIRMVAAQTGIITTIAGPGVQGTLGDGGPATSAYVGGPYAVAFGKAGDLYIADTAASRIRMISAKTGIISTVAGGGTAGELGDGGLATAAYLADPQGVALDSLGNLYISDAGSARIRKVEAATGVISTIAGNGTTGATGDGGPATAAEIEPDQGIDVDVAGNVYISGYYTVRKVDATTGVISTIAGDGYYGYGGDGGAATMAELFGPQGLAFDASGSLYIADCCNYVVRKVTFAAPAIATLTSPTPGLGTTLGTANVTFQWTTVVGAADYQLNLSAVAPGQSELFLYKGTATSATAVTLPANGAEVYATLYTKINGVWLSNSYVYYESGTRLAALTAPTPGLSTILAASNVTFQWTTGAGVTDYQLNLSAIASGGSDLYLYKGTATTATVTTLPANGQKVYATLYSKINGVWQSNSYVYTESGTPTPAVLTSPAPGLSTILGTSGVIFKWNAGIAVTDYQLNLSSVKPGNSELYLYKGTAMTATVPNLPANAQEVYARLYSYVNGAWQYNDYVYTEGGTPTPAALTSPTPGLGTVLGTSGVIFKWNAGVAVTEYQLNLSSVKPGNSELYSYKGTATTATATTLPANGMEVYARLYSYVNGAWQYNDYVYTEGGTPTPAALTSPTPGLSTILGTTNVNFQWSAGVAVSEYQLNLSAVAPGGSELLLYKGTATTATAPTLPAKGVKVYARLYSKINGAWQYNDYVYTEQ